MRNLQKCFLRPKPRQQRSLRVDKPILYPFQTEDGVGLQLTRYKGGDKGPVMLVHGLGVASSIFSTNMIDTNLLEYLFEKGYDVWLLDFRVSINLASSKNPSDADQVAKYDYPAAVDLIRKETKSDKIQAVVHCYGASTFFMSMLAGLEGISTIVCSQIATHIVIPKATKLKTGLYVPSFLEKLGINSLTAYTDGNENPIEQLYDKALGLYALGEAQGQCNNDTCHRITFMYASLYCHDQLTTELHDNLNELFGEASMRTFMHIAQMCRKGHLVDFDGNNTYLPNIKNLDLPILFISGSKNECYYPESTELTFNLLKEKFTKQQYSRKVIDNYGHLDCIFGKNADKDVYPHILEHLDKYS